MLVTHDQAEALSLGQSVGVLRRGALVQFDTPQALYRRPVDVELARFVGEAVLLGGEATGMAAACCLGTVGAGGLPCTGRSTLMVRPEQLQLGGGGTSATVAAVRFHGADASVGVVLGGGEQLVARIRGWDLPQPGTATTVRLQGDAVAYPVGAPRG